MPVTKRPAPKTVSTPSQTEESQEMTTTTPAPKRPAPKKPAAQTQAEPPREERVDAPKEDAKTAKGPTKEERAAAAAAHLTEIGLTGEATYSKAAMAAIRQSIEESLVPEMAGIRTGLTQFSVSNALDFLRLMANPGIQRDPKHAQAGVLALSMRAALGWTDPDNVMHPVEWYTGTNSVIIADDDSGLDARTRSMARVLATGTKYDIDTMLRIVNNHEEATYDEEGNYSIADGDLLKPYQTGWKINGEEYKDKEGNVQVLDIPEPDWPISVQIGAKRESFVAIDTENTPRTPWDMVKTGPESGFVLSKLGLLTKEKDVITPLRQAYLRASCRDVPTKEDKTITEWKYGSVTAGGKEPPERYRIYSHLILGKKEGNEVVAGYLARAIACLNATLDTGRKRAASEEGYKYNATYIDVLQRYHVLTIMALALQAGYTEEDLAEWIDLICVPQTNGEKNAAYWVRKYCEPQKIMLKGKQTEVSGVFVDIIDGEAHAEPLKGYKLVSLLARSFMDPVTVFDSSTVIRVGKTDKRTGELIQHSAVDEQYDYNRIYLVDAEGNALPSWDTTGLPHVDIQQAELIVRGKASQGRASKGSSSRPRKGK